MRRVELVVLSDIHLGTRHCQADSLLGYLNGIDPGMVILNGDIFDMIEKDRKYWPDSHMQVVRQLLRFASNGVPVHYITGNHDILLRQYSGMGLGQIHVADDLELDLNGKKTLFVHGDVFDCAAGYAWIRWVGGLSYQFLMAINRRYNDLRRCCGKQPFSLATFLKSRVKHANRYITRFVDLARQHAAEMGYDAIVCGHIHKPALDTLDGARPDYLNSGDWTEHCTALEYQDGEWVLHTRPHLTVRDQRGTSTDVFGRTQPAA